MLSHLENHDHFLTRCRRHNGLHKGFGIVFVVAALMNAGCSEPADSGLVTDMHHDFDHEHKHQHGETQGDHEHEHEGGFQGSHTHEHSHGHRHGEPLFGGKIVSIGHAHHEDGATHFHAEVMPIQEGGICFHVMTDADDGSLEPMPIEATELTALIGVRGKESLSAECTFTAVGDERPASQFSVVIPESIAEETSYSIVVPKIEVGGHRQNFSFQVQRGVDADKQGSASSETAESDG